MGSDDNSRLPEILAPLAQPFDGAFVAVWVGERSPLTGRPWRFTCRMCGTEFYPLASTGAVANMEGHLRRCLGTARSSTTE